MEIPSHVVTDVTVAFDVMVDSEGTSFRSFKLPPSQFFILYAYLNAIGYSKIDPQATDVET